jgi:hypothetical protein
MGAPPEVIKEWEEKRSPPPADFGIHEDNWEVFMMFSRNLSSQWDIGVGFGGVIHIGIPIPRIESLFNIKKIPVENQETLLEEIQLMERSALAVLNKVKKG